ncbi:MAG TPA: gliding motility-associated C-terminal domain-containing protein [Ferruginibacter sp.]|nr:gliding motility-associated C-terminal domain-containing protein [Ferruginibacter sp.]HMP21161.1 gliding motility-associated C-terminal domain-containing protein [Ferruginibacter sp.]
MAAKVEYVKKTITGNAVSIYGVNGLVLHYAMMIRGILIAFFTVLYGVTGAQTPCTTLGQNPSTAFPVCGTDTFFQSTVPGCGNRRIPTNGCNDVLTDINPFWYRFTCFETGTLGFTITPNDLNDDYDWQLFDITGRNPEDLYTDPSMFVAGNWSGETGKTGASAAGNTLLVCGSFPGGPYRPLFSAMPQIIKGHEYLLLVSHFTVTSQSGYSLSFGGANGGTAVITDPTEPHLAGARAICDGEKISIKLNKKMKCSSLKTNGSDFVVTPAIAPIISAVGVNCNNSFDLDSIVLTLAGPIPPGNYTVSVRNDANGRNLLDNCDRSLPDGDSYAITVYPLIPTLMDSITKPACAPTTLDLVFKQPIRCNTIAADGSDFVVTLGSAIIPVTTATGTCNNEGLTSSIRVQLAAPLQLGGNYRITLNRGSDGNTLINECGMETPAGSFLIFPVADTVSAAFNYNVQLGCTSNTVFFSHDGNNGTSQWQWTFGNTGSSKKDTAITYPISVSQQVSLTVSNGVCSATATATVMMDNAFKAAFEGSSFACPGDPVSFRDKSTGKFIRQWHWDMSEGKTSNLQHPPQQFYLPGTQLRKLPIRLIVTDSIGCRDTAYSTIEVVNNCYIAVPKAFTPNGDGLNDFLYPTNAYKAKDLKFRIYNRGGQLIFETSNWLQKWNGTFKGNPQDPGTYVWTLTYTHTDTGERINQKGTTILLR